MLRGCQLSTSAEGPWFEPGSGRVDGEKLNCYTSGPGEDGVSVPIGIIFPIEPMGPGSKVVHYKGILLPFRMQPSSPFTSGLLCFSSKRRGQSFIVGAWSVCAGR